MDFYNIKRALLDNLSKLTHNSYVYVNVASIASGYRRLIRVNKHNHARALCPAYHVVLGAQSLLHSKPGEGALRIAGK